LQSASAKKFGSEQDANGQAAIEGPEAVARAEALQADGHPQEAAKILSVMVERKAANWGPAYPAAQVLLARADKQMATLPAPEKHTNNSSISGTAPTRTSRSSSRHESSTRD